MRAAFTLVDTAYAATIGDAAVAAVGLTVPFEFLMIAVWVGLSTGLTSCLSRAMGAGDNAKVRQYLAASWRLVLGVSPLFLLVAAGIWMGLFGSSLDPVVSRSFRIYGSVLVGGSALTLFWSVIPDSVVKAHHDTRSTMWAGIWSNLINVALNTLFTFVFHWGVFGIALSTVLGRIGGLIYALARARQHETRRMASATTIEGELDPRPYQAILSLATPSGLTFALTATETAVVNWLLARGPDATESIAAFSVYYRVALFALNPVIATAVAMLPFAARKHGSGDVQGLVRSLRQALLAAAAYSLLIVGPVALILGGTVARWIAESARTSQYASVALRLVPVACLISAPFLLCRPLFEGMGRGRPGFFVAILRFGLLAPPLTLLGIRLAAAAGRATIYGALGGTLAASAVASGLLLAWVRRALRDEARIREAPAAPS